MSRIYDWYFLNCDLHFFEVLKYRYMVEPGSQNKVNWGDTEYCPHCGKRMKWRRISKIKDHKAVLVVEEKEE